MNYLSVTETAKRWQLSERAVRNYAAQGRIPGAKKQGGSWFIPEDAQAPMRKNASSRPNKTLLKILQEEKQLHLSGRLYHRVQIDLTYNSNHIEGSTLTHDQTRYIFETNTIGLDPEEKSAQALKVDDVVETINHFRCIDYVIDHANYQLSERMVKKLHALLKTGTSDAQKDWFAVGAYKKLENEVGGKATTPPGQVSAELKKLLRDYENGNAKSFDDLLDFHYRFECIHPFQDGNGRIGRLILFKECLRHGVVPFIISDDIKLFYYRGLKEWEREPGYLRDTCLHAQDEFKQLLHSLKIDLE